MEQVNQAVFHLKLKFWTSGTSLRRNSVDCVQFWKCCRPTHKHVRAVVFSAKCSAIYLSAHNYVMVRVCACGEECTTFHCWTKIRVGFVLICSYRQQNKEVAKKKNEETNYNASAVMQMKCLCLASWFWCDTFQFLIQTPNSRILVESHALLNDCLIMCVMWQVTRCNHHKKWTAKWTTKSVVSHGFWFGLCGMVLVLVALFADLWGEFWLF